MCHYYLIACYLKFMENMQETQCTSMCIKFNLTNSNLLDVIHPLIKSTNSPVDPYLLMVCMYRC